MDEQKNLAAWECLDQALFTSSHVKAKDIEKGSTNWDNVYPVSKKETERMEALVNEAENIADAPAEQNFRDRVNDLRDVISYSYAKHRTWKWSLIFGSIIAACIFWYFGNQDQETAAKYAQDVEIVKKWAEMDTTITYEKLNANSELSGEYYNRRLRSANAYKLYKLHYLKMQAESNLKMMKDAKLRADTIQNQEKKEATKKYASECEEKAEKYQDELLRWTSKR